MKQRAVKLIPVHHRCDLNHSTNMREIANIHIQQYICVKNAMHLLTSVYLHYFAADLQRYRDIRRSVVQCNLYSGQITLWGRSQCFL